jgi:quinol monooxygenase YgiN
MNRIERSVSIHPYFKVHPGRMEDAKAIARELIARTSTETEVLYYEFTISGDTIFCREAYTGAAGLLAHLTNVSAQVEAMLALSSLARVEIHGPAEELEQLRGPFASLNPTYFVYECGVQR